MSHLLSREKLEELLPRLLSGVNSLYRKHNVAQYYTITQVRCDFIHYTIKKRELYIYKSCLKQILYNRQSQPATIKELRGHFTSIFCQLGWNDFFMATRVNIKNMTHRGIVWYWTFYVGNFYLNSYLCVRYYGLAVLVSEIKLFVDSGLFGLILQSRHWNWVKIVFQLVANCPYFSRSSGFAYFRAKNCQLSMVKV